MIESFEDFVNPLKLREKALINLKKAKENETKKINYSFMKINERTKVFRKEMIK